jgi:hypothetical protein
MTSKRRREQLDDATPRDDSSKMWSAMALDISRLNAD